MTLVHLLASQATCGVCSFPQLQIVSSGNTGEVHPVKDKRKSLKTAIYKCPQKAGRT